MKKFSLLFLLATSSFSFAQNFEISTLRIGDFKVFMPKAEADKIANKNLLSFEDYEKSNKVNYYGESVDIKIMDQWVGEYKPTQKQLYVIKTKSTKFKTKSGMGVGNTRDQLIEAYRNYPNFSVNQYNKLSKEAFFNLQDSDAGTYLSFILENNIVVEVSVGMEEGC
ncbi:hypothetical protein [Chryseobacterium sp. T1]